MNERVCRLSVYLYEDLNHHHDYETYTIRSTMSDGLVIESVLARTRLLPAPLPRTASLRCACGLRTHNDKARQALSDSRRRVQPSMFMRWFVPRPTKISAKSAFAGGARVGGCLDTGGGAFIPQGDWLALR